MQLNQTRTMAALLSAALVVSVAGVELSGRTASAAEPGWTRTASHLPATSDTYVTREFPQRSAGSRTRLVVRNTNGNHKRAYLKFVVPKAMLSNHGQIESVVLELTSLGRSRSDVSVRSTKKTAWSAAHMASTNAPQAGATIAKLVRRSGGVNRADLTSTVHAAGTYGFALTTNSGVSRYYSSESKVMAPRLTVTVRRPKPTPKPPTAAATTPGTTPGTTPSTAPRSAPSSAPTPTTTPTTTPASGKAMLGMSAPNQLWDQRVSEVGSGLEARRLFFLDFAAGMGKAQEACDAGTYPVMSFKTGAYSWAQVAAGTADADLRALATRINALTCDVFVAIHHEPEGDGTPADWSAMAVHALPILGGPIGGKVKVGVIGNGWWWSGEAKGYTDAQIAAWVTPGVLQVSDVIAGDTYQGSATGEEVATKITRMGAWARRVGGVRALGLGEFNTQTAQGITNATTALGQDPLFAWGCLWNADGTGAANATVLTGDRLTAFRSALAAW